jgi:hypothetical protein
MTKPTGKPTGRPPVTESKRKVPMPGRLEAELRERLEAAVPKGKRGAFVRDAVREKLDREAPPATGLREGAGE